MTLCIYVEDLIAPGNSRNSASSSGVPCCVLNGCMKLWSNSLASFCCGRVLAFLASLAIAMTQLESDSAKFDELLATVLDGMAIFSNYSF